MREQPLDNTLGMHAVALLAREWVVELIGEDERWNDLRTGQGHGARKTEGGGVAVQRVRQRGVERRLVFLLGVVPQLSRARERGLTHLGPDAPGARFRLAANGDGEKHAQEIAWVGVHAGIEATLVAADSRANIALLGCD